MHADCQCLSLCHFFVAEDVASGVCSDCHSRDALRCSGDKAANRSSIADVFWEALVADSWLQTEGHWQQTCSDLRSLTIMLAEVT